jgi:IS6 family transposase
VPAQLAIAAHAFIENLRRGHYELGVDTRPAFRVAVAITEPARAI